MRSLRIILVLAGSQLKVLSRKRTTVLILMLPGIVLYTVFTMIFAGPAGRPFRVAVVDEDRSQASRQLIEMLEANNVVVIRHQDEDPSRDRLTAETAREAIRRNGVFRVAVVIPKGYGESPNTLSPGQHRGVNLHYDVTQTMEADVVTGILQMAAGRAVWNQVGQALKGSREADAPATLIKVNREGVVIDRMAVAAKHTFLASVVPMFILFGATGAARGLLEMIQSGEIRRLMVAPIQPFHILGGQTLSSLAVSVCQCVVMYTYAWLVFDVAIWQITAPLVVLTLATCLAATTLGTLMASFCATGEQLDAVGTMIILAMSAVGGSMVPKFVMPIDMQKLSLFTINGWSFDGFYALIRNEGFAGIVEPCAVLLATAAVLAVAGGIVLRRRFRTNPFG